MEDFYKKLKLVYQKPCNLTHFFGISNREFHDSNTPSTIIPIKLLYILKLSCTRFWIYN